MTERPLTDKVLDEIKRERWIPLGAPGLPEQKYRRVGGWAFKVWGSAAQMKGIPDVIGCHPSLGGRLMGIEVKDESRKNEKDDSGEITGGVSPIQQYTMDQIAEAGGFTMVVATQADVDRLIRILDMEDGG